MSKNLSAGFATGILGIIYTIAALNLPQPNMGDGLGPRVFPLIIGILLILLSLLLVLKEIKIPKENRQTISFQMSEESRKVLLLIALTSVCGIVYGVLLDRLGYLISTAIFMLFVMFLVNKTSRWLQNIIVAVTFSFITYVGFATLLHLSLPRGIIHF